MKNIDPTKSITDVVIFDGASNVQLRGDLLKIYYLKLNGMNEVEHTRYCMVSGKVAVPVQPPLRPSCYNSLQP